VKRPISYLQAFDSAVDGAPGLDRIEIPLIQRDYAQGRHSDAVDMIRRNFLDAIVGAITSEQQVPLDFVYGDVSKRSVDGDGKVTLRPLDGQQRLTTLFLLHWYVAFRIERLAASPRWTDFTYATRPSARLFCERVAAFPPPEDTAKPSDWIRDQAWFLHAWRHDPTVQSMLVVIEAIDDRLGTMSPDQLDMIWARLSDPENPAVVFHILPIDEFKAGDELYIKMNSRGKPLTPFENFKATFEGAIEVNGDVAKEFSHKVDQAWADTFWSYRGDDDLIDDEFMRYFEFVTEVAEWRANLEPKGRLEQRAEAAFADGQALRFLVEAFDAWTALDVADYFNQLFTTPDSADWGSDDRATLFFGIGRDTDLFHGCCRRYGEIRGEDQREFSLPETLLLYAVLYDRILSVQAAGVGAPRALTTTLRRRLRILRNVLEASSNELRLQRMPAFINEVEAFMRADDFDDALAELKTFNKAQLDDEVTKAKFLSTHPELTSTVHRLEDLPVLRGSIVALDLDEAQLPHRAEVFEKVMASADNYMALSGALLSIGDYSQRPSKRFHFGSAANERVWTQLLTGTARSNLKLTAAILGELVDRVSPDGEIPDQLRSITTGWLDSQSAFDWRYYLAKYDTARSGPSGIYASAKGQMGFVLCMLQTPTMRGYFRDPYLSAIREIGGLQNAADDPRMIGWEESLLWLQLKSSGTRIRCIETGFQLAAPPEEEHRKAFEDACSKWDVGNDLTLTVGQREIDGRLVDTEDRIQKAAAFLKDLVACGL
jgi:hypothetical protein